MKHYKTKTGTFLHCIQGESLGDGVPRGQLQLVTAEFVPEPMTKRWFAWVMTETVTHIKIGPIEYKSWRIAE